MPGPEASPDLDAASGAAGGLQGPGQEGVDLVAGGDIAVEEWPGGTTAETRPQPRFHPLFRVP
jgi:hypothetical protein